MDFKKIILIWNTVLFWCHEPSEWRGHFHTDEINYSRRQRMKNTYVLQEIFIKEVWKMPSYSKDHQHLHLAFKWSIIWTICRYRNPHDWAPRQSQSCTIERESEVFPVASVNSHCSCQSNYLKYSSPFNYCVLFERQNEYRAERKKIHVMIGILVRKIIHRGEKCSCTYILSSENVILQTLACRKAPLVLKGW